MNQPTYPSPARPELVEGLPLFLRQSGGPQAKSSPLTGSGQTELM